MAPVFSRVTTEMNLAFRGFDAIEVKDGNKPQYAADGSYAIASASKHGDQYDFFVAGGKINLEENYTPEGPYTILSHEIGDDDIDEALWKLLELFDETDTEH